jgi:type IV secretory pathway VirJ component
MVNRLPEQNRSQIAEIALLGPSTTVSLQMQPIDYLWRDATAGKLDVLPEMTRLAQDKVFCICGDDEPDSLCRRLDPGKAVIVTVPGGHHFGGDYEHVADLIIRHARSYREQAKSPVQPETGESPKPPDSGPTNVAVRLIGSAQLTIR